MASLDQIEHFVVLMLENRSFDNLFGFLYPGRKDFHGLTGNESIPDGQGGQVRIWSDVHDPATMRLPNPDPGEHFDDMNQQLYNGPMTKSPPLMNGFAQNYVVHQGIAHNIMHAFDPAQLPAFSQLARSFAVCDSWHASAPCQTWPNRFFVHTATADGYENNKPHHFPYQMETIFNRLEGHTPDGWKIYFHDFPQSLTLSKLWERIDHFHFFGTFLEDAKNGALPSYAFIEPRYFPDTDWPSDLHPPHHVAYGDQLVAQVYNALRQSPQWDSTLLIVTFDEHGGCYDHVPPGPAVSPEPPRLGQVFAFDRYGVRVPAVLVSPFIAPGTVYRSPGIGVIDHTSIITTLRNRFGIDQPLTQRDEVAPDLTSVLSLDAPSNAGPSSITPAPSPPEDTAEALAHARQAQLNDFEQAAHETIAHIAPLAEGIRAADHIEHLLRGTFTPTLKAVDKIGDAIDDIKNVIGRLID